MIQKHCNDDYHHSKHFDEVLCLYVRMIFESADEVKNYYREYAIKSGFGIRIRTSKKNNENQMCYLKLVCVRPVKIK